MAEAARNLEYTLADVEQMEDGQRYELSDGRLYLLASPTVWHQNALMNLAVLFRRYFRGKPCQPYLAPLDVCLFSVLDEPPERIRTVRQPDLFVVCDPSRFGREGKRLYGAPELAVEILSESSAKTDLFDKMREYFAAGVQEYWVVVPEDRAVSVYVRAGTGFVSDCTYVQNGVAVSTIFPGLEVGLAELFSDNRAMIQGAP